MNYSVFLYFFPPVVLEILTLCSPRWPGNHRGDEAGLGLVVIFSEKMKMRDVGVGGGGCCVIPGHLALK